MIHVRTLGEAVVETGEVRLTPAARVRFGLMLYCAVERGRRLPRRTVTELLWPGVPERTARHCLRHAIYRLRAKVTIAPDDGPVLAAWGDAPSGAGWSATWPRTCRPTSRPFRPPSNPSRVPKVSSEQARPPRYFFTSG